MTPKFGIRGSRGLTARSSLWPEIDSNRHGYFQVKNRNRLSAKQQTARRRQLNSPEVSGALLSWTTFLCLYSKNMKEHQEHLRLVLERLRSAGLQASISKCECHVTRTKYLGFIITTITTEGIEVDPEKISVIKKWAVPTTVSSFLGFCNFYRRFIKNYSGIARGPEHCTG